MDSKVSYGRRGHADSGVAWIAKCRTRGFLWAGKRCDSRVAVRQRGVRQLASVRRKTRKLLILQGVTVYF